MTDLAQTSRQPETSQKRRHRARAGIGLWVTDQELYERLGVPPDTARVAIRALDEDKSSGFPKKQPLWGDRRYLPAIEQWFEQAYQLKLMPSGLRRAS